MKKQSMILRGAGVAFAGMGFILNVILIYTIYKIANLFNSKAKKWIHKHAKFAGYHVILAFSSLLWTRPFYLYCNGSRISKNKTVSICNHVCDFDWIYIMRIYYYFGLYEELFFLLKNQLVQLPLIGYILLKHGHIPLTRTNTAKDIATIENSIKEIQKRFEHFSVFIFPEGTYPSRRSVEKSLLFSEEKQIIVNGILFQPKNILMPRTNGFNTLVRLINPGYILDSTILNNPYILMLSEKMTIVEYLFTEKIHISPIFIVSIVSTNKLDENFVFRAFDEKNKLIEKYKNQLYNNEKIHLDDVRNILGIIFPEQSIQIEQLYITTQHRYTIFTYTIVIYVLLGWNIYKLIRLILILFK